MLYKKIIIKISSAALVSSFIGAALTPTTSVFASEKEQNILEISNTETDITLNHLYNKLSKNKKKEFLNIVKESNLNFQEQVQLLQDRKNNIHSSQQRWKISIVKKAAQLLAIKIGSKSVADITDYLLSWEDDLQQGMENYLVYELGWDQSVAYWTAKSVMFIIF
ncbi:hypothetical protein ABEY61_28330 [Bacillus toyonensis]|uniref:hypothetical protein n=1 Tax=Bacillus toyonensis TaxID=155322 RepID=UPI003D1D238B